LTGPSRDDLEERVRTAKVLFWLSLLPLLAGTLALMLLSLDLGIPLRSQEPWKAAAQFLLAGMLAGAGSVLTLLVVPDMVRIRRQLAEARRTG